MSDHFAESYHLLLLRPKLRAVVDLASSGMRNKKIAKCLNISETAVKGRMRDAFDRLGVDTRLQMAVQVTQRRMK